MLVPSEKQVRAQLRLRGIAPFSARHSAASPLTQSGGLSYGRSVGLRRRAVARVVAKALVLAGVAGCGSAGAHTALSLRAAEDLRPQAVDLRLDAGSASAHHGIVAPSPKHHTFDVRINAPARLNVTVWLRTTYGTWLGVTTSTKNSQGCRTARSQEHCLIRFPILEAQPAGRWTVLASKRSGPAAIVRITITFARA
jgi:hypothetical protein